MWELDELQYELGEGPCVHVVAVEPVTTVEWAAREQRWPRFMPLALAKGLRSQLGMRLYTERETLGGLNMYSTCSDTIDPDVVHMAELFAAHASLALGHARREEQLSTALLTRKVIGQAIGILMERHALDEDGAFAYLTRAPCSARTCSASCSTAGWTRRSSSTPPWSGWCWCRQGHVPARGGVEEKQVGTYAPVGTGSCGRTLVVDGTSTSTRRRS